MTNEKILEIYRKGWSDGCSGKQVLPENEYERIAYSSGQTDFSVGDDAPSIVGQSDQQIIDNIKLLMLKHRIKEKCMHDIYDVADDLSWDVKEVERLAILGNVYRTGPGRILLHRGNS